MLHCYEYTENCAVFNFLYFSALHFVCWRMREVPVQGIFGHYKVVSRFSALGHGSCAQHLFLLYASVHSQHLLLREWSVFTLFICSVSAFIEILQVRDMENLSGGFTNLNHLKNHLFVMSNSFMFLLSRNDLVFLPQFSLSFQQ